MNTLFRDSLKSRTLKTFHGTSVCEKKNIYSVTYFPYMCCVTGINVWGNSSVLLNCRFYGPVRGYTHTWKSTGGLFSRYWMGKAVSVNAKLSETFFFFFFKFRNNEALLVWWPRNGKCNLPSLPELSASGQWDHYFLLF